jgi:small-conductance mechanosensitive channel
MSHRPSRFKSDLNFAIEEKLREAGIEIPFPQREVRIRGGSVPAAEEDRAGGAVSDAKETGFRSPS